MDSTGGAGGGFCGLFGTTTPFTAEQIAALYPTHAAFVQKWDHAVAADVADGYLLPPDARMLDQIARSSTVGG